MDEKVVTKELKAKTHFKRQQTIFVWIMLALPILSWLVWSFYGRIFSVVISFQDPGTNEWSLVNFKSFWISLTTDNPNNLDSLNRAFKNTLCYYILNNFILFPIQIIVSYFLYKKIFGFKFFRIVFYFPAIVSGVAMTGVFKEFISPLGPLGDICRSLGIDFPKEGLLGLQSTVNPTMWVYMLYVGIGGRMLIACGTMARIPTEVLESGRLDGTTTRSELLKIVIPCIMPMLSIWMLTGLTGFLSASGPVLLLAPDTARLGTTTINYWLFSKVFAGGVFGQGEYNFVSAASWCFTLVQLPIVLGVRKILSKVDNIEY